MNRVPVVLAAAVIVALVAALLIFSSPTHPVSPEALPQAPNPGSPLTTSPATPPAPIVLGPPSSPGGPPLLPEHIPRINRSESGIQSDKLTYQVSFPSGTFTPPPGIDPALQAILDTTPLERIHVIAQFEHLLTLDDISRLRETGLEIMEGFYAPGDEGNTMLASLSVENSTLVALDSTVLWLGPILTRDKTNLIGKISPIYFCDTGGVEVTIDFFPDISFQEENRLKVEYSLEKIYSFHSATGCIPQSAIEYLAREEFVKHIEPSGKLESLNADTRNVAGVTHYQDTIYYLNGSGVSVGIWDVDNGAEEYYIDGRHVGLSGRVTYAENNNTQLDFLTHATHVAGTFGGNGSSSTSLQWKGVAPNSSFVSYEVLNDVDFFDDHNVAINTYRINISQNSWGPVVSSVNCETYGDYGTYAKRIDNIVNGSWGKPIVVVFAAGNDRDDGDCSIHQTANGFSTLLQTATAKNAIVVGAVNINESMTNFSSWGPTDDWRIKPDVVAPGCKGSAKPAEGFFSNSTEYIYSTTTAPNNYLGACGTSMAAPVVSGIAALLFERYKHLYPNEYPLPSSVKGLIVHGAKDLNNSGPDYTTGWGLANASASLQLLDRKEFIESYITTQNETDEYQIRVVPGQELHITLVWDDPGTAFYSLKDLVNDLDLSLIAPNGTTYYPFVLDGSQPHLPATSGVDSLNNVEQVKISNPIPGLWRIKISGKIIASMSPNGQNYSLIGPFSPEIRNLTTFNASENHSNGNKAFKFHLLNNNLTAQNVSWGLETGNGTWVNSTGNLTLQPNSSALVFVESNYTSHGTYEVTAFASNGQWWNDSQKLTFTHGWLNIRNLSVVGSNGTERVFGFKIKNLNATDNITNLNWTIDFGDNARAVANTIRTIANGTEHFFYIWHNYTAGNYTVRVNATNGNISGVVRPLEIVVS